LPKLMVRKAADVPSPVKTSRAVREQQELYESFIKQATGNVGEMTLDPADAIRSIKVRLRRAGTRLGVNLDIWDADGKVYFQAEAPRTRRGRPRKTT
jgi:hypothetical protein